MNYKKGLQIIKEMNVAGGPGGMFGYGGNAPGDHGGDVGNSDFYASGDARVPKILGVGGNDPYKYVRKDKKNKKRKNTKMPIYRRTFVETMTSESVNDNIDFILYTENTEYGQIIKDLLESHNITFSGDNKYIIIEGTDNCIQTVLEKIQNILTSDPFENGEIVALIGEMDINSPLSPDKLSGGLAEHKTMSDFYNKYKKRFNGLEDFYMGFTERVNAGIKIEKEHTNDFEIAKEITLDHLWEDLDYYSKLAKIEKRK